MIITIDAEKHVIKLSIIYDKKPLNKVKWVERECTST